MREGRTVVREDAWTAWPVYWTPVIVGALASVVAVVLFGIIGTAVGTRALHPRRRRRRRRDSPSTRMPREPRPLERPRRQWRFCSVSPVASSAAGWARASGWISASTTASG